FSAKTVHLKENMVKLTISVKDTGIGISAENQKKIFTSFWKLKNRQEKIQQQGAGLGLSITQKLLNLMYTNLLVDSEEGKGSTFYFTIDLPVFRNNTNVFEPKNYKEQNIKLNGLKVLVAEDNKLTMLLTTRILEEAGATVVSTYNGKATLLKLTEESDFNMILLDLNMPEIDGYTVMETINEKYSHIPTLAFTANLLNNDMYQRLLKQGFLDCILKPYEPEELLITVKRFATKRASS
ncbi:MAG: response regulator, partial [Chitinophagaceae bacterium]